MKKISIQKEVISSASDWFDSYGNPLKEIPEEAVNDCIQQGQDAYDDVMYWIKKLNFEVPRDKAIQWLKEFGAWPLNSNEYDKGLSDMDDEELASKVFWLACGEIKESGEWFGLQH